MAFLTTAFAISYPLGIAFNLFVSTAVTPGLIGLYLPRLVTVVGPGVAAIVVAASGGGFIRVSHLVRACRISGWQIPWFIVAVAVGITIAGASFVFAGIPSPRVTELVTGHATIFLAHLAVYSMIIGLGEEVGWRGWLLPSLAQDRSFGMATAITGLTWAIWHAPVFFSSVFVALSFLVLLASLSVILAWVWKRSRGSIALVATAHGAANAPFLFLESAVRKDVGGNDLVNEAFLCLSLFYAFVATIIVLADRPIWLATRNKVLGEPVAHISSAG